MSSSQAVAILCLVLSCSNIRIECRLQQEYYDLMENIMKKSSECTVMLFNLQDIDPSLLMANVPMLVVNGKTGGSNETMRQLVSAKGSHCTLLFARAETIDERAIEYLLNKTTYRTVFVFMSQENRTEINFKPYFIDSVIVIQHLYLGNLKLNMLQDQDLAREAIWLSHDKKIITKGKDFIHYKSLPRASLRNRKDVVVSTMPFAPFVNNKGNGKFGGMEFDIMDMMSKVIGFRYSSKAEKLWEFKDPVSEKWTGIVGSVCDGNSLFGTSIPMVTSFSTSGLPVHHSPVVYTQGLRYLVPRPHQLSTYLNFVRPFTLTVWLCLLASLLVATVMTYLVNKLLSDEPISFWKILMDLFSTSCQQNLPSSMLCPTSVSYALVFGLWIILMTYKGAAYNCDLRSFIIKAVYEKPIDTDEDILSRGMNVYTTQGTGHAVLFLTSESPSMEALGKRMIARHTADVMSNIAIFGPELERLVTEGAAKVVPSGRIPYFLALYQQHYGYQPMRLAESVISEHSVGYIMPLNQPWTDEVDSVILHVIAGGFVDQMINRNQPAFVRNAMERASAPEEDVLEPYRFEHIAGPIMTLSFGLIMSLIVFIFERVHFHLTDFRAALDKAIYN